MKQRYYFLQLRTKRLLIDIFFYLYKKAICKFKAYKFALISSTGSPKKSRLERDSK